MNPIEPIAFDGEIGHVAALEDGRILSCYTERDSLTNLDEERPERWTYVRISEDGGRTWTEPQRAFAFPAGKGVSGSNLLLVAHDGSVHIFSLRFYSLGRDKERSWHSVLLHTVSKDGGKTWSALKEIDFGHDYTGALNCALQMDNGRILVPLSYLDEQRTSGRFVSMVVYSDDDGQTWGRSNDCAVSSGGEYIESGACEPVVVQFRSGMVWMVIRTQTGYFWESFSNDGAIWTPPRGTRIVASNAPAGVLRLRDGRIVMFWNNLYGEPFHEGISYARQYLHGAISDDEGQTWSPPEIIAHRRPHEPPNTQTTYPFLCQAPDGAVVLVYYRIGAQPGRGWNDPVRELVRVDPEWLARS